MLWLSWGSYVGNLVNSYRAGDGSTRVVNYVPRTSCLNWRPTLPLFAPALLPQWPRVRPFGVGNVVSFALQLRHESQRTRSQMLIVKFSHWFPQRARLERLIRSRSRTSGKTALAPSLHLVTGR